MPGVTETDSQNWSDKKSKIIVCIDDELSGLVSLSMLCESYGYRVEDFTSPIKALDFIKEQSKEIGLVFLDLMMPEMYGMNVLKKLKGDSNTAHIPVIMNSCLTDPIEIKKSLDIGAKDFISKPFSKAVVINAIAKHIIP